MKESSVTNRTTEPETATATVINPEAGTTSGPTSATAISHASDPADGSANDHEAATSINPEAGTTSRPTSATASSHAAGTTAPEHASAPAVNHASDHVADTAIDHAAKTARVTPGSGPAGAPAPSRIVFLDYLRVIACFMVILVHCIEPFYLGGEGTLIKNATDAMWSTLLDSALRAAVPLFVLASSYLLLPLRYDAGTFFKKRFIRVCIPLIIWTLLYALIPYFRSAEGFDRGANLQRLLVNFNPHSGHLWFVYMLLGLYLIMPVISPWLEKASKRTEEIALGIWGITTLIPFLRQAALAITGSPELYGEASWNEFGTLHYISGFAGFLLLGHYFRKYVPELSWKKTLLTAIPIWAVGYAITAGWFWQTMPRPFPVEGPVDIAVKMEASWQFTCIGVVLTTIAYFMIIRKITSDGAFYRRIILPISKLSYGMYLMHMFILIFFHQIVAQWSLPTLPHILLTALLTFTATAILTRLISLLPGSKYIVG